MAALSIGAVSALLYLRGRRWTDALLALLAGAALACFLGEIAMPSKAGDAVTVNDQTRSADLATASGVRVAGDGLRAAHWRDLPARPLQWSVPQDQVLHLDFPRQLPLGRVFELRATLGGEAALRLQLLGENGQLLAEGSGKGAVAVQWLAPLAETMVLQARLFDGSGKLIAGGPVPLEVQAAAPLRVQGRFAAPSFDLKVLNERLAASNAVLDWQVTLGKALSRSESAREAMPAPDLLLVDAAWFERQPDAARSAVLAQVAEGRPLLILGATARDPGVWSRILQLALKAEPEGAKLAGALALPVAPFNPVSAAGSAWTEAGARVWTRSWQGGQITWLGVADWHRFAISEPQALGLWWQEVLDLADVRRSEGVRWLAEEAMPLAGERLAVCALGAKESGTLVRRADMADAACSASWPAQAGWLETNGHKVYVYADGDWPLWQKALRRDATAAYAARTPRAPAKGAARLRPWPFGVLFTMAMLALWWRERR